MAYITGGHTACPKKLIAPAPTPPKRDDRIRDDSISDDCIRENHISDGRPVIHRAGADPSEAR
jgi:hypothetical protein